MEAAAISRKRRARPKNLVQFFGRIDADLHRRFKGLCEQEGRTKSKQLERMMTEYLEARGW